MGLRTFLMLALACLSSPVLAENHPCALFGAEYVPQNESIAASFDKNENVVNRTLSFVLRIEKGDMGHHTRSTFLNFDAYNKAGEHVSTMRLVDTHSNGFSRQSFSTYWGMYCTFGKDDQSDCQDMKMSPVFYPIGVNKDLSLAGLREAPPLLIFPETFHELTYKSYQAPQDWEKYIRFYTDEKIYPDFRGYDFWVRRKCGGMLEKEE